MRAVKPKLTISMPVGPKPGDRKWLPGAVRGLLSQTFEEFRLVIVNDGGAPIRGLPKDPRIVLFDLPTNRGRYFCDALVLKNCKTLFWGPHDSDDWSPRRRYELMMAQTEEFDAVWSHRDKRQANPEPGKMSGSHAHHAGLYRVADLFHGPHPDFRCAWDSVFVSLCLLYMKWTVVFSQDAYYYHRRRPGALSYRNKQSPERELARILYEPIWRYCCHKPVEQWYRTLTPQAETTKELALRGAELCELLRQS
jgi:glycosyltransferase involved in cell wall biosynthesis